MIANAMWLSVVIHLGIQVHGKRSAMMMNRSPPNDKSHISALNRPKKETEKEKQQKWKIFLKKVFKNSKDEISQWCAERKDPRVSRSRWLASSKINGQLFRRLSYQSSPYDLRWD